MGSSCAALPVNHQQSAGGVLESRHYEPYGVGRRIRYDGAGRRVQQTVGANVTKYVLDTQPR
jgi:hypothetical protein